MNRAGRSTAPISQRDDTGFLAHSMTAAEQTPLWQPVHIVNIEPGTRAY